MDHHGHHSHDMHGHGGHSPADGTQGGMGAMGDTGAMADMGHGEHMMGGMMMVFHGGYEETVLFSFWKFNTVGGLLGSIIVIFIMAVLYEGLKYYREYLFWKTHNGLQYKAVQQGGAVNNKDVTVEEEEARIVQPKMMSKVHGWQTFLHAVQVTVSYFLMLIFMTYNSWLCLAVVLGAATGNFLFGWRKQVIVDVTEHCH